MKDLFSAAGDPSAPTARPKLPNMNEFSPGVLGSDLQGLLLMVSKAADRSAVEAAIVAAYPMILKSPKSQRQGRAANVLIGMSQCGLIKKNGNRVTHELTSLGIKIRDAKKTIDAYDHFARHLIENCHGSELIDVVKTIRLRGEPTTIENIRTELRVRGFIVTENEGNSSKIRKWLEATPGKLKLSLS